MAQFAFKSCDICMSGPGKNCCKQCDQWLCDFCKTLHLRSKISRNHTFLNGESINQEDKLSCREHDENFIFYCIDCDIPICKMCIVNKHKRHDTSEINESIQGLQAEVKQVIELKIKSAKTNLNKIEQGTDKYHNDIIEAIRAITEDGKEIKQEVDQQVLTLKASLVNTEAESYEALEPLRTELRNDIEKLEKCHNDLAESQKITDVAELLKSLKHIKSDLDDTMEKEPPMMPTVKYAQKDKTEKEIFKYFGEISVNLAKFTMQPPPPPRPQPPQSSSPPPQQLQPAPPPSSQQLQPPPPTRPQPPQPSSPSPQQHPKPSPQPQQLQQSLSPPPPQSSSPPPPQQLQPSLPPSPQQTQPPPPPRPQPPQPSSPSPQQHPKPSPQPQQLQQSPSPPPPQSPPPPRPQPPQPSSPPQQQLKPSPPLPAQQSQPSPPPPSAEQQPQPPPPPRPQPPQSSSSPPPQQPHTPQE
ncbi:Hypothetical predicted protein, partial [Mytilus galloprovincialis]